MPSAAAPTRRRGPFVLLAPALAPILVGTMALGGIYPLAASAFALVAAIALGVVLVPKGRASAMAVPYVTLVFAGLALYTLLQTVPLPLPLLRLVAPANADAWTVALAPIHEVPAFAPISLAPELTLVEAAKWFAYAAVAWIGFDLGRSRGLSMLALVVLALASSLALVTLLHGAFGATKVFGIYQPYMGTSRFRLGPVLNPNHLSAYLSFGVYAGVAWLAGSPQAEPYKRAIVLLATGGLVLVVVLLASRAGVGLLLVGAALTLVAARYGVDKRGPRPGDTRAVGFLVLGLVASGIALALLADGEQVVRELTEKNLSKLVVAREALPMIKRHLFFGVGRGAFEGAFPAYHAAPGVDSWTNPEDFVVQWLSEWGLVGSIPAWIVLGLALVRSDAIRESIAARTLLVAIVMAAAHDLVDFSLELPATASLAALVFGALNGSSKHVLGRTALLIPGRVASRLVVAGPVAVALAALLAMRKPPNLLHDARRAAFATAQRTDLPVADAEAVEVAWVRRFPADPYFPLMAGVVAGRARPLAGMPWFNRAVELGPASGFTHQVIAQALADAGYHLQALMELHAALERDPVAVPFVTATVLGIARNADELLEAAPDTDAKVVYLRDLVSRMNAKSPSFPAVRTALLQADPCASDLRAGLVRERLAEIAAGGRCAGDGLGACRSEVTTELSKLVGCDGGPAIAARLEVDLLWVTGDRAASLRKMDEACPQSPDLTECLRTEVERAAVVHDRDRVIRNLRVVVSRQCAGTESCAGAWAWAAATYVSLGEPGMGYQAIAKASELEPANLTYRLALADLAIRAGAVGTARTALAYVLTKDPTNAEAQARMSALARQ